MKRLVIVAVVGAAVLAVGVAIAIAATSGGSQSSTNGHTPISVKRLAGAGSVLVDAKGRALYRNEQEHGGSVLCTGACLSFWKPLIVSGVPRSASLPGKLAVIRRPDGRRQATYDGKPLYTFTLDKPGKVTGDGFKDSFGSHAFTWHVEHPSGATTSQPRPATKGYGY